MTTLPADVLHCIVEHIASQGDLSVLCRCNRALNEITIPRLYSSLNFSIHEAGTFSDILDNSFLFQKHGRRLSVTDAGSAHDEELCAYEEAETEDLETKWEAREREDILYCVRDVIERCSERGLTHFSWNIGDIDLSTSWLLDAMQEGLRLSGPTLSSIDINLGVRYPYFKRSLVSEFTCRSSFHLTNHPC